MTARKLILILALVASASSAAFAKMPRADYSGAQSGTTGTIFEDASTAPAPPRSADPKVICEVRRAARPPGGTLGIEGIGTAYGTVRCSKSP